MGRDTENLVSDINYWREYPERDVEFVRWYPCRLGRLSQDSLFKKRESSFYIHIPFCRSKCHYCSFVSFNKLKQKDDYLKALFCEIEESYQNEVLNTIYLGGGTPSVLEISDIN